jgi:catechol 2,3-dioxygenase-like lactoylglutathione lyase family enzyme
VTAGQVTLAFWNPESDGLERSPNQGGIALRVADMAAAHAALEAKGVEFEGEVDSGVCKMAFCKDPDGNYMILHRRYAPYE